ncbi:MAG: DUF4367 domain-containing protein [Lachnospiraceae bacterium]|nr:DUF4367 domain-containing protein [Lachnospiraceae bacterium]
MNDILSVKLKDTVFAAAVREAYHEEIQSCETADFAAYKAVEPDEAQTARLYVSAEALPEDAKNAIIGLCCFGLSAEDVTQMYGVAYPVGTLRYYTRLLSRVCGLSETEILSEEAMRRTGEHILRGFEQEAATKKQAGRAKRRGLRRLLRPFAYAAAALLCFFSLSLAASAELRAIVLKWFSTDRQEYSEFTPVLDHELSVEEMYLYEPMYIPEGYTLEGRYEEPKSLDYEYYDEEGWYISIVLTMPGVTMQVNTANSEVYETAFQETYATMIIGPSGYNSFITSVEDYPLYISGRIDAEELVRIAENIKKQ